MRFLIIVWGIILIILSGCLSDIRPDFIQSVSGKQLEKDGRQLLENAAELHGVQQWKHYDSYTAHFHDNFRGIKGWFGNAFKEKPINMDLRYDVGRFNGEMEFTQGKKTGEIWGFVRDRTYRVKSDGTRIDKESKKIRFWVPTVQYFIEFPLRILEATAVRYAGEDSFDGNTYDIVLASWKTVEPQKDIDQYLIWISQTTGMIDLIQYTVRDQYGFLVGTCVFEDVRDIQGMKIPHSMPVYGKKPGKNKLHHMEFDGFVFHDKEMEIDRDTGNIEIVEENQLNSQDTSEADQEKKDEKDFRENRDMFMVDSSSETLKTKNINVKDHKNQLNSQDTSQIDQEKQDEDEFRKNRDMFMVDPKPETLKTKNINVFPQFVEISRESLDRNCGSCHHSNRSEDKVALTVFDLANPCWYCTISKEEAVGLDNRSFGSEDFSSEEQKAIKQVVDLINNEN